MSTGVTDTQLAVLLRQVQWALDDAAHDFPAGRGTPQRREELAGSLEALAGLLRASAPDNPTPPRPPVLLDEFVVPAPVHPATQAQTPAGHRLSAPRAPAPGDRPVPPQPGEGAP